MDAFANALILTGPTGSGKSDLAVKLAQRLNAEIVSMDSMALYRGIDIATAKVSSDLRRQVPHHLVDVLDPWESASVAWWLDRAAERCADIERRGRQALIVGGTILYLKAILHGLFDGPPADLQLRRRLEEEAATHGNSHVHEQLARVDPDTAERLHPNDLRRVVRALEVWELTGSPMSSWQTQWRQTNSTYDKVVWLDIPRHTLYTRIDARVLAMIEMGLIEETRRLRSLPRPLSKEASQALGYKEMLDHLDGRASLKETIVRIQTRSRNFAKRQLTWLRHLPECRPVSQELTSMVWTT